MINSKWFPLSTAQAYIPIFGTQQIPLFPRKRTPCGLLSHPAKHMLRSLLFWMPRSPLLTVQRMRLGMFVLPRRCPTNYFISVLRIAERLTLFDAIAAPSIQSIRSRPIRIEISKCFYCFAFAASFHPTSPHPSLQGERTPNQQSLVTFLRYAPWAADTAPCQSEEGCPSPRCQRASSPRCPGRSLWVYLL